MGADASSYESDGDDDGRGRARRTAPSSKVFWCSVLPAIEWPTGKAFFRRVGFYDAQSSSGPGSRILIGCARAGATIGTCHILHTGTLLKDLCLMTQSARTRRRVLSHLSVGRFESAAREGAGRLWWRLSHC